jgi:hypothetical protein
VLGRSRVLAEVLSALELEAPTASFSQWDPDIQVRSLRCGGFPAIRIGHYDPKILDPFESGV